MKNSYVNNKMLLINDIRAMYGCNISIVHSFKNAV